MPTLTQRLANNEVILIDGGTGTELERHNVPMVLEAWSAAACLTHPDVVRAVHETYIRAGAEMIIANTYACSRHLLAEAGLDEHFEMLNTVSVELALEARDNVATKPVTVAGSISTTEMMRSQPPIEVARGNYIDQARIQAAAGAEMFTLEMMREITHTQLALDAVYQTELPVWVGYSCVIKDKDKDKDKEGEVWLYNETVRLVDALQAIQGQPIELIAIMHTQTEDIDACLDVLQANWDGPIAVYAHSGDFIPPNWQFIDMISPEDYAAACMRWVERGVQVIGGCCGIGPEHIELLAQRLPRQIG